MSKPKYPNDDQSDADQVSRPYDEGEEVQQDQAFPEDTFASVSTPPDATLYGGDVDAAQQPTDAGEETVGGSSPTPDQDVVEELGDAVGITYEDHEPLRFGDKLADRDAQRWELNPASSEDYRERLSDLSGDGQSTTEQVPRAGRPTKRATRARSTGESTSRSGRRAGTRTRQAQKKKR